MFDGLKLINIANNTRVGMKRTFGTLMTPDLKPGIEVHTIGRLAVMYLYREGKDRYGKALWEKYYEVELPAKRAQDLGGYLISAADYLERGSGLKQFGTLSTPTGQPGVEVSAAAGWVTMCVWRQGARFTDVTLPVKPAKQLGTLLVQAGTYLEAMGSAVPPDPKLLQ